MMMVANLQPVANLCWEAVPVQSDWLNNALIPVVYGDIAHKYTLHYILGNFLSSQTWAKDHSLN